MMMISSLLIVAVVALAVGRVEKSTVLFHPFHRPVFHFPEFTIPKPELTLQSNLSIIFCKQIGEDRGKYRRTAFYPQPFCCRMDLSEKMYINSRNSLRRWKDCRIILERIRPNRASAWCASSPTAWPSKRKPTMKTPKTDKINRKEVVSTVWSNDYWDCGEAHRLSTFGNPIGTVQHPHCHFDQGRRPRGGISPVTADHSALCMWAKLTVPYYVRRTNNSSFFILNFPFAIAFCISGHVRLV